MIEAHYTKSSSEVFEDTTKYMINSCGSFWPMYVGHMDSSEPASLDVTPLQGHLASWAPDWRTVVMRLHCLAEACFMPVTRSIKAFPNYAAQEINTRGTLRTVGYKSGYLRSLSDPLEESTELTMQNHERKPAFSYHVIVEHTDVVQSRLSKGGTEKFDRLLEKRGFFQKRMQRKTRGESLPAFSVKQSEW